MNTTSRPFRAVLNFAHHCTMNCEWCYVRFESKPAFKNVVFSIVNRIAELGFTSITIGGGDPFQYRFAPDLLRFAKSLQLFTHVDTHGISLRESQETLSLIDTTIDLVGLPLDGSTPAVHDLMRGFPGHFDLIQKKLLWLHSLRGRIKLNTVISAANAPDLLRLGSQIALYKPLRWSIYQYWPLGIAAQVKSKHFISDADFEHCTKAVSSIFCGSETVVEISPRESRRNSYPIIHHDGKTFIHTDSTEDAFIHLGNIFDPSTARKILLHCHPDRPEAAHRYQRVDPISAA